MAVITFDVQSLLASAGTDSITIDDTSTIAALKTAVSVATGVDVAIMRFGFEGAILEDASTIASYGIVATSFVQAANSIGDLPTRQAKQEAKLALAQLRRQAGGDTAAPYYRPLNTADIDLLPTKYVGDVAVDNAGPLVLGRPWT